LEYAELLKRIGEIEAGSARAEQNFIDLSLLFTGKQEQRQKGEFRQLLPIAMNMEAEHLQLQQQKTPTQAQAPRPTPAQPRPAHAAASTSTAPTPASAMAAVQPQQPRPAQAQVFSSTITAAKGELNSFAKNLGGEINTFVKMPSMKPKEGENVLPRLSLADQVAELERIIEGLNEHAFSREQLEVVRNEAFGLKKFLQKATPGKESGDMEHSLILGILRDKRLDEVLAILAGIDAKNSEAKSSVTK
jgi:hypothetical protein